MTEETPPPSPLPNAVEGEETETSEQAELDMAHVEEQLTAIQEQLGVFVLRAEVEQRLDEVRRYADAKIAESETRSVKLVDQVNQTLQSINDTITGLNRTISGLNTTVSGLDGQMKHFGSVVNQVTARQDAQSREQDQLRVEQSEIRKNIESNRVTISQHQSLMTGQGQAMREIHEVIFGNGTRESVFGMLREMQETQKGIMETLAKVVSWQENVNRWVGGGFRRLGEAWAYQPVRMAAAGAAISGGLAMLVEVVKTVAGG